MKIYVVVDDSGGEFAEIPAESPKEAMDRVAAQFGKQNARAAFLKVAAQPATVITAGRPAFGKTRWTGMRWTGGAA